MSADKDPYSLEHPDDGEPDASGPATPDAAEIGEKPPDVTPAVPEDAEEASPEPSSVRALDVCPNCGAPMRDEHRLRCLRCGYDLKTMRVEEPEPAAAAPVEEAAGEPAEPLVRPLPGDPWLPLGVAAAAGIVIVIGLLAGSAGLFVRGAVEGEAATVVPWPERLEAVARWLVLVGLWTGCGIGGVAAAARLLERPRGDLPLIAARIVAIVAVAGLARFASLPYRGLEFVVEAVGELLVFVLLAMLMFRLKPRDALTTATLTITAFLAMYVIAQVVGWVT